MALDAFLRWLSEEELVAREDASRVAADLGTVVRRIADGGGELHDARAIDIGSGVGAVAFAAADRGARVTGVDVDPTVVAKGTALAARFGAPVRHVGADARALPFRDGTFDASVHRSVLIYLPNRDRAVEEEFRVLRPGGKVSCSESLGEAVDLEVDDSSLRRTWTGLRALLQEASSLSYSFAKEDLVELYERGGFIEVALEPVGYMIALDTPAAVARVFQGRPGAGLSAREYWERAGVPAEFLDDFMTRLAAEADRGHPARLLAPEGFLTARRPPN